MEQDTRPCARCGVAPRNSSLKSYCVDCKRELSRESRARVPKKKLVLCSRCQHPRTGAHPCYCVECFTAWKAEKSRACLRCKKPRESGEGSQWGYCPRCQRDVWMQRRYGISIDEYEARLEAQGGRCAICGSDGGGRQWHVDHEPGSVPVRVRGILCELCNRGLGHFKDSPELLRRAADYLE